MTRLQMSMYLFYKYVLAHGSTVVRKPVALPPDTPRRAIRTKATHSSQRKSIGNGIGSSANSLRGGWRGVEKVETIIF
eukprot:468223-Prorocentrum_minimum.AAC.1